MKYQRKTPEGEALYPGREKYLPERVIKRAVERMMNRVEYDLNGGCWLWPGAQTSGYGVLGISHIPYLAHRLMYTGAVGSIPNGMLVLHKCDVRACFRPDHLFLGEHDDNSQDCAKKNRIFLQSNGHKYWGRSNPNAKLTWEQVQEIRSLHDKGYTTYSELSKQFGVSHGHIHRLVTRKQYFEPSCPDAS